MLLYDAEGRPIAGASHLEELAKARARRVFDETLAEVPPTSYASEDEMRRAFTAALTRKSGKRYPFDIATGKLKLKLPTRHWEITAECDAYGIVKRIAGAAAAGGGTYLMLRRALSDSLTRAPGDTSHEVSPTAHGLPARRG